MQFKKNIVIFLCKKNKINYSEEFKQNILLDLKTQLITFKELYFFVNTDLKKNNQSSKIIF